MIFPRITFTKPLHSIAPRTAIETRAKEQFSNVRHVIFHIVHTVYLKSLIFSAPYIQQHRCCSRLIHLSICHVALVIAGDEVHSKFRIIQLRDTKI